MPGFYPSGQKVSSGSLFTGTHAHIYILRRLLLPEHYGVPLRLHVLNSSDIVYSNRDVTTNYRHSIFSKPLRAERYVDLYNASISRSIWTSRDIYNSLFNLHRFDKLFFVWNYQTYCSGECRDDGSKTISGYEFSSSVLL